MIRKIFKKIKLFLFKLLFLQKKKIEYSCFDLTIFFFTLNIDVFENDNNNKSQGLKIRKRGFIFFFVIGILGMLHICSLLLPYTPGLLIV